jgi:hypothetical protein
MVALATMNIERQVRLVTATAAQVSQTVQVITAQMAVPMTSAKASTKVMLSEVNR